MTLTRTIDSEFLKIRSVRSTYGALGLLVVAAIAWCLAFCLGTVHNWPAMSVIDRADFDPTQSSVLGVALLGQLVIVVFGALVITSEYSTGMIRTSLTVMPRRATLYWSKLGVFAAVSLVLSLVTSFGVFFLGKALLGPTHVTMSLSDPAVLRSVLITALYVEVCGLLAYGVGALSRNTAAGLSVSYGCLALLPQLVRALPAGLEHALVRWVPGGEVLGVMTESINQKIPYMFSPWGELAIFAGYAAVLVTAGSIAFIRRDA
jgi:ABC-type transport system involved in multi-copper enzyme maturation permease subunit